MLLLLLLAVTMCARVIICFLSLVPNCPGPNSFYVLIGWFFLGFFSSCAGSLLPDALSPNVAVYIFGSIQLKAAHCTEFDPTLQEDLTDVEAEIQEAAVTESERWLVDEDSQYWYRQCTFVNKVAFSAVLLLLVVSKRYFLCCGCC